jgi:hypothetical protein
MSAVAACSRPSTVTAAARGDPLYNARRTLHTGADLLTGKQTDRLRELFDPSIHGDKHVEVEAT